MTTEGGRTHVIPNSINYSEVKPEQIENTVKLIRFTPTANVQQAGPNDVIKFMLQGNGFLDPFSTYIDIEVDLWPDLLTSQYYGWTRPGTEYDEGDPTFGSQFAAMRSCFGPDFSRIAQNELNTDEPIIFAGKYLDRSAHSFIHRFVARSQGEELERIEEYDVLAGMINDVLYSREQKKIHVNEGFPHATKTTSQAPTQFAGDGMVYNPLCGLGDQGASIQMDHTGWSQRDPVGGINDANDAIFLPATYNGKLMYAHEALLGSQLITDAMYQDKESAICSNLASDELDNCELYNGEEGAADKLKITDVQFFMRKNAQKRKFTFPIYSGILGVLMPDKKLIPLNLMPLELEFSMNQHALYCLQPADGAYVANPQYAPKMNRDYTITKFEIYANVIMFEQQVHRALDKVVATQGLYIPFNTFYLAPQAVNQGGAGSQITAFSQINVYFKSINSIHTVFLYSGYRQNTNQRKLHFVSHRLQQLQLRNGTEFTPSERILGDMGEENVIGAGNAFYIEMLKSYNKLHDPATDAAFEGSNYYQDGLIPAVYYGPKRLSSLHILQGLVGRCQYGISLEGEEMGKDKTTLSGRRGMQPFDLMQVGYKTMGQVSNQLIFVRADMVIFIRQDLVVQLLGR